MSDEETTVEIRREDIRDVLHWIKWPRKSWEGYEPDPINARWLAEYGAADDARKKGMLANMEDSLAWVLREYVENGPWSLWSRLLEASMTDAISDIEEQNEILKAHATALPQMTEELGRLRERVAAVGETDHHRVEECDECMIDRRVAGHCPICSSGLFLTSDNKVECVNIMCSDSRAVTKLLGDPETEHIVRIEQERFHVKHPLRERIDDGMLSCTVHTELSHRKTPPAPSGTYRVRRDIGGVLRFEGVS